MTWHPDIPEHYQDDIVRGDLLRLLLTLPDNCVDAVVTDPPYSSGGMFRGDRTKSSPRGKYQNTETVKTYPEFSGDSRDQRGYHYWLSLWLAECWRIAKSGAPIGVCTDWRQLPVTTDAIQSGGWVWRGINVWDKTEAARPQKGRFRGQCEFIVWGSKGDWWDSERQGISAPGALRLAVNSSKKNHITAKPVEVMRWLLSVCPPGGVVLDPCIGSGTTGKAALEAGMHFVGFELSPEYEVGATLSTEVYQVGLQQILGTEQLPLEFEA